MKKEELYEYFVRDWQDEYGPLPEEYVPDIASDDFKEWLKSNLEFNIGDKVMYYPIPGLEVPVFSEIVGTREGSCGLLYVTSSGHLLGRHQLKIVWKD